MEITDVFTPRASSVNRDMYVERTDLELSLTRAVKRNMHAVLFGDSGTGKSWLYKKVLADLGIPYKVANCANASRMGSLTSEICSALIDVGTATKTGYKEEKEVGANAVVFDAKAKHSGEYELTGEEPLLAAFRAFSQVGRRKKKVLVLDNLESIFDSPEQMDELANIVILLDDERYSKFDITMLLVGVPDGVIEYFAKTKNLPSVANRIQEVNKVGALAQSEVGSLVLRGFELLKFKVLTTYEKKLAAHVHHVTIGVPQRVHEYCEFLAYEVAQESPQIFRPDHLEYADSEWWKQGFRQSFVVMKSHLNSRDTRVARRNQVIYVIGNSNKLHFDANLIESQIRKEFPTTVPKTGMGIGNILSELSAGPTPFLKKLAGTNEYCAVDPLFLICVRLILYKDAHSGKVMQRKFQR